MTILSIMLVDIYDAAGLHQMNLETNMGLDQTTGLINLSFIIKTNGEIVPAMPDDEEFSPQQLGDYVAGTPEVFCQTHDGFYLFHNKEGKSKGLPRNELAAAMYVRSPQVPESLVGKVFVAHPTHIASYWKGK